MNSSFETPKNGSVHEEQNRNAISRFRAISASRLWSDTGG